MGRLGLTMGRWESDCLSSMGIVVDPDEIADASSGINMGKWVDQRAVRVIIGSYEVKLECFGVCYV